MTVCDFLAYLVLVLFIAFMGWHQWLIVSRQHAQILGLERLVALKAGGPEIQQHIATDQQIHAREAFNATPRQPEPEFVS